MIGSTNAMTTKPIYSFTINYSSDPASITYGEAASGMDETARRNLLRSHDKHALVKNGRINYWLNPSNANQKADGSAAVLTGADGDVCVAKETRWWSISRVVGGAQTVRFAWWKFSEDAVTSHWFGSIGNVCRYLAEGVFEGTCDANHALRSINVSALPQMAASPDTTVSGTSESFVTAARVGHDAHYNITLPMTWSLACIDALFEHGTRNLQSKVGRGWVDGNTAACNVNNNWSATDNWNRGDQTGKSGVTLQGIHNRYGNVWKHMAEMIQFGQHIYLSILGGADHMSIEGGRDNRPDTWVDVDIGYVHPTVAGWQYPKEVCGNKYLPFMIGAAGGSGSTYYPDGTYFSAAPTTEHCCLFGAYWGHASDAGLFCWLLGNGVAYAFASVGARLQILIE